VLKPGGLFGFLTHNQTLEAFELYIWKGEYELGFIPKGNHDFHKFLRPDELSERLAAQGLQPVDITGLTFDLDNPHAILTETTTISYLGYAIKQ
jgi:2-polyprenyl-6-hydroxyphenyl methylase / 3-demethylubiquinone-9 3-methyltransferase